MNSKVKRLKYKLSSKLKRVRMAKTWFMSHRTPKIRKFQNKYKTKWETRTKWANINLKKTLYSFLSKVHFNPLNKVYYNPLSKVQMIYRAKIQKKITKRSKKWRRELWKSKKEDKPNS